MADILPIGGGGTPQEVRPPRTRRPSGDDSPVESFVPAEEVDEQGLAEARFAQILATVSGKAQLNEADIEAIEVALGGNSRGRQVDVIT